ncbi:MAG: hypothetical protein QXI59_03145 [Candidatus Bathyarchaeia archaeon]|nr:hypothetical protein [Candidatus Bathyarchaeota archaeon]
MTILKDEGDGIIGRRIVYIARKVSGPRLVRKSGRHRGLEGILYDAEAYIDIAVEKPRLSSRKM